jgi:hypothetical protein
VLRALHTPQRRPEGDNLQIAATKKQHNYLVDVTINPESHKLENFEAAMGREILR